MKQLESTQLSNAQIDALAMQYKSTGDELIFNELMAAVQDLADHIAWKMYSRSRGLNLDKSIYEQEAYLAVYFSIESYDSAKGSYFTAHLKRNIEWRIQDNIFKNSQRKVQQFHTQALSLDVMVGDETFLDVVEEQVATSNDLVFDAVSDNVNPDHSPNIISLTNEIIAGFSQESSEDDKAIIETTFAVILSASEEAGDIKRKVTKALTDTLGVTAATARKKKSRAFARLEKYAATKNFNLDMSQF